MRWPGFRRVRSQVCKRIRRRLNSLDLDDLEAYQQYLETHADEWTHLDAMCRITISRFYRDHGIFEALAEEVFPSLATTARGRGDHRLRAWSCGCASGEEAYSLAMLWGVRLADRHPGLRLEVVASDADSGLLERAHRGVYPTGSIRELPDDLRRTAMEAVGQSFRVRDRFREGVSWLCQDVRVEIPQQRFDLILCRNLVLTYFDDALQREVMDRIVAVLRPDGALVIGSHEVLSPLSIRLEPWCAAMPIHRRTG
jgi:chemotaxis protein methyltransferase CheR